jgi:hypothetical protein
MVSLRRMLDANTFDLIDKWYGEFHPSQPVGVSKQFKDKMHRDIKTRGIKMWDWVGERVTYEDFEDLHKPPAHFAEYAGLNLASVVTCPCSHHSLPFLELPPSLADTI